MKKLPIALVALAPLAPAQEILHETTGEFPFLGHGFSIAVTADRNGDR